jgi:hypothetical protein
MANKKKSKKKPNPKQKQKKGAGKKAAPAKKQARKRAAARKRVQAPAARKTAATKKALKKTASTQRARVAANTGRNRSLEGDASAYSGEESGTRLGDQAGDLQGLSNVERADSESVDELLEEGNAFEAGIVSGVENSDARGVKEVRTREVPEDDVPGEYLDED